MRKVIIGSTSYAHDGQRGGNAEAVGEMKVEMIAGTPMEQVYLAMSPHPDHEHLQALLNKLGAASGVPGLQRRADPGDRAPTLITVGDCDTVKLEHAAKFLRLRGGDVNGDFEGVPASQLAVFPGRPTSSAWRARISCCHGPPVPGRRGAWGVVTRRSRRASRR